MSSEGVGNYFIGEDLPNSLNESSTKGDMGFVCVDDIVPYRATWRSSSQPEARQRQDQFRKVQRS
jgi:hypothetical protein